MIDQTLQIYLPAFMLVALFVIFFWHWFRPGVPKKALPGKHPFKKYRRFKRINPSFTILFVFYALIIVIYSYFPDAYSIFIPLDFFHHPMINLMGLLILKVALVMMVIAQSRIDSELYKLKRELADLGSMELIWHSEKMLLKGMITLFAGIVITVTNLAGVVLFTLGTILYYYLFYKRQV